MYSVALVCEGPADRAIIEAVLDHYLDDYEMLSIQPPTGLIGGDAGPFGGGWKGVRRWCGSEVAAQGGLDQVAVLQNADLLVVQVDADVAEEDEISLARPCPPPADGADEIRTLVLQWLDVAHVPDKVVLCIPSMASETWALVALFPDEGAVVTCEPPPDDGECIECRTDIKALLRKLGGRHRPKNRPKLVVSQDGELKNQASGYRAQSGELTAGWTDVLGECSEARRFDTDLRTAMA